MKTVTLCLQIHQPFRLKKYRFFDIGKDHYYYDDFNNDNIINKLSEHSYIPVLKTIRQLIEDTNGNFKVAFSISGTALEQIEIYTPEVLEILKELSKTGNVEFLAETYSHSLCSLLDKNELQKQIELHTKKINNLFGQKPTIFRNTELIYSNEIGENVYNMGLKGMIVEGSKQILEWRSANYIYNNPNQPQLKLLMRNHELSDEIATKHTSYNSEGKHLSAEYISQKIANILETEKHIHLFMNMEAFGNLNKKESGIFSFLQQFVLNVIAKNIAFDLPSNTIQNNESISEIDVQTPKLWADEDRNIETWLGNRLQKDAYNRLRSIITRVRLSNDKRLIQDLLYLQSSDHFLYMNTQNGSNGNTHNNFSPYNSPFDAFTNYMNILSDFIERVNAQFPESVENEELNSLITTINNQDSKIEKLEMQLASLKKQQIEKKQISIVKQKGQLINA